MESKQRERGSQDPSAHRPTQQHVGSLCGLPAPGPELGMMHGGRSHPTDVPPQDDIWPPCQLELLI